MKSSTIHRLRTYLLSAGGVLGILIPLHAAELKVPSQYPSIQAAVDAANTDDVIRIAPGVYTEQIIIDSKKTEPHRVPWYHRSLQSAAQSPVTGCET